MNVFLDTNTLLDVLSNRLPFFEASVQIWELSENNEVEGWISAISYNNIFYIVRRQAGLDVARTALEKLRAIFHTAEVDDKTLSQAIDAKMNDFEDAIQYFSALRAKVDYLITRNPADFPSASLIKIVTPEIFLATLRT